MKSQISSYFIILELVGLFGQSASRSLIYVLMSAMFLSYNIDIVGYGFSGIVTFIQNS